MPVRVTRSVQTVAGAIARLPSARRTSSSLTPASISAPSTMSPAAPAKQSKYRTFTTCRLYPLPSWYLPATGWGGATRNQPRFNHRVVRLVGEDEMVHDINAHDLASIHQSLGQDHIVATRCGIARGVIVKHDDGGCRSGGGLSEYLARMNDGAVEGTDRQQLDANNAIFRVEHQDAELLHRRRPVFGQQIPGRFARCQEARPLDHVAYERPASELNGGDYLRGTCVADARDVAQRAHAETRKSLKPAGMLNQAVGKIEGAMATNSATEDDGHELVIAESGGSEALQLLARPIVRCDTFHLYSILHASLVPRRFGVPLPRARRRVHVSSPQGNRSGAGCHRCRSGGRRRPVRLHRVRGRYDGAQKRQRCRRAR